MYGILVQGGMTSILACVFEATCRPCVAGSRTLRKRSSYRTDPWVLMSYPRSHNQCGLPS